MKINKETRDLISMCRKATQKRTKINIAQEDIEKVQEYSQRTADGKSLETSRHQTRGRAGLTGFSSK